MSTPVSNQKLLYISGYGRSGSTVLEMCLAFSEQVEGLGELENALDVFAENPQSTTGVAPFDDFWNRVRQRLSHSLGQQSESAPAEYESEACTTQLLEKADLIRKVQKLTSVPISLWLTMRGDTARYLEFHRKFFEILFEESGADVLIDSSKSDRLKSRRLYLLSKLQYDTYNIILVRDLKAIIRSVGKGSNRKIESGAADVSLSFPFVRALWGWFLANATALVNAVFLKNRNRTRLLSYADFCHDPRACIRKIYQWMDVPLDEAKLEAAINNGFANTLQISGNRARLTNRLVIKAETSADEIDLGKTGNTAVKLIEGLGFWTLKRLFQRIS